jgi:arylsulfatase A-like enzyme
MWHLAHKAQPLRPQRGFERFWISTEDQYTASHAAEGYSSYHDFLLAQGYTPADPHRDGTIFARTTTTRLPEEVTKPAFQAAEAIRFLETYGDEPFLLVVGIHEPHPPCHSPFDDLYRPEDMTLPESWYLPLDPRAARHCHTVRRIYAEEGFKTLLANDEWGWKEAKARYWGLCKLVDRSVGRVLRRLEGLGLADDTIVVYTADHGHLLGEHRMWNKGVPYEPSVQVPLLLRVPGLAPRRITTPVGLVRLMPTLLELMGQPIPAHVQGTSLVPLLTDGDTAPDEEAVFIEWNGPWRGGGVYSDVAVRTIRQGRWKLNVSANGDCELYDLQDDPEELRNAVADQGRAQTVGRLFDRLRAWQRETDDPVVLPHP